MPAAPKGTGGKPLDRSADPPLARKEARKEARKDRIRTMLKDSDGQVTAKQIAAAEDISDRQAQRLLSGIRKAPK
ncbi:hypothetical protein ACQEVG_37190 [Streptomyces sp. CA-135486]|uniref:hypothetical protein n=1 Tax=Streptomyces sp. CA-135486 TaxID=3240049 RepID=UPI003D8F9EFE